MDIPIARKGYVVYTKSKCVWCQHTKKLLPSAVIVNCDAFLETSKDDFLRNMSQRIGKEHRTFPMVFYDGGFIGGYEDTKNFVDFDITQDF